MSSCWKCGKTLPGQETECEGENCRQYPPTVDAQMRLLQEAMRNRVQIDWAKVKTADDLLLIISVIFHEVSLPRDSREAHFLQRYLKSDNSGAEPTNPA
jgi:hypothetical protein